MKSFSRAAAAALLVAGLASPAWAGQVRLEIRNGLVTLDAKDATVREILAEWARVGQTRIVNAERVPGAALTLQLTNVPEAKALDILLRTVAGYMAAPRVTAVNVGSRFDRILVMPQPRPAGGVAAPGTAGTNPTPPPIFENRPRMMGGYQPQQPSLMVDDQDEPVAQPQPPSQPMPPPMAGAGQPGMTTPMPQQPGAPAPGQTITPGAVRPGNMTPPPKQPGPPGGN